MQLNSHYLKNKNNNNMKNHFTTIQPTLPIKLLSNGNWLQSIFHFIDLKYLHLVELLLIMIIFDSKTSLPNSFWWFICIIFATLKQWREFHRLDEWPHTISHYKLLVFLFIRLIRLFLLIWMRRLLFLVDTRKIE